MPKQSITVPRRRPDESPEAYSLRLDAWANDPARTKTDLRDWTGSPPFHLDVPAKETPQ